MCTTKPVLKCKQKNYWVYKHRSGHISLVYFDISITQHLLLSILVQYILSFLFILIYCLWEHFIILSIFIHDTLHFFAFICHVILLNFNL